DKAHVKYQLTESKHSLCELVFYIILQYNYGDLQYNLGHQLTGYKIQCNMFNNCPFHRHFHNCRDYWNDAFDKYTELRIHMQRPNTFHI
ncbi:MAG: hypothetical protein ACKPKO_65265, partial [Candidatus Fonsibacter sp.]